MNMRSLAAPIRGFAEERSVWEHMLGQALREKGAG
jgi:hypothetical protein